MQRSWPYQSWVMSPARDQKSRFLGRRLQIPWSCCWFKWQLTFVFHVDSHTWKVTKAISTSVRRKRSVDICLGMREINLHDHWIESSSLVLLLNGGRLWNLYIQSLCAVKTRARRERAMWKALFNSLCMATQQQANLNQNKRVDLGLALIEPQTLRYN